MKYSPILQYNHHDVLFQKLENISGFSKDTFRGKDVLIVEPHTLTELTKKAFFEISHFLRPDHLKQIASILKDPEASENDRFVAMDLLKNANISAAGILPMCQDTGTALVFAKKGGQVWTNGGDEAAISEGIRQAFNEYNLRYSQMAPLNMYKETNTKNNLPAQIDIMSQAGASYDLMFIAKGGGSANKSYLYQKTRAVLNPESLHRFLEEKIKGIGTSACPPYHLAVVIGGTSAEMTMKTLKLASCHYLDNLPMTGDETGRAFRDKEWEDKILTITGQYGIGAQFGGKYFCHDVRVIRLPRHGASLPIGIGVSCSADRQILAKITFDGVELEQLEHEPAQYIPDEPITVSTVPVTSINLNQGMKHTLSELTKLKVSSRVELNGSLIVARDIAHARIKDMLDSGKGIPDYFMQFPVYYAGPAKKPDGYASGSFGPTTAGRMDPYVGIFQEHGASMVSLAKGNRSKMVKDACQKYGGFYLGTIGGSAAGIAKNCIKKIEQIDFEDLGMEAVWKIEVEKFPAFVVIDDKGNDFYGSYGIKVE